MASATTDDCVYAVIGKYSDTLPTYVCGLFKTEADAKTALKHINEELDTDMDAGTTLIAPLGMYYPPSFYIKKMKLGVVHNIYYGDVESESEGESEED